MGKPEMALGVGKNFGSSRIEVWVDDERQEPRLRKRKGQGVRTQRPRSTQTHKHLHSVCLPTAVLSDELVSTYLIYVLIF